jgi:branched-chain amino acid transport system substrate-binding protein
MGDRMSDEPERTTGPTIRSSTRASGSTRVSRRAFLGGVGGAGLGGLIVGGVGGYLAGNASDESSGGGASSSEAITIGVGSPVTGPFAGDGQQMVRGVQLAVEELNAMGGVGGRQLKTQVLDTKAQEPDVMKSVLQKFVSQKVAAMLVGFTTYTSVEYPIAAEAKIPMFHVNTWQGNVDYVAKNAIKNIYQGDPSQLSYGPGLIVLINDQIAQKKWTPSSKTIAVVSSNDPYSLSIAKSFESGMNGQGWKTTMFEQFTVPQADYGAVLVKIRDNPPGIIFFSDYAPGDEASFIKQFQESPTPSLVYQQYAPSIPEYLDLAKDAANGVLWSTVVGVIPGDKISDSFNASFKEKFGREAGFSNAGDHFDMTKMWAMAAGLAGDPYDFVSVNQILTSMTYRGVCGAYTFSNAKPGELTCIPYPDETSDPSIGMAHLTFQIQNGEQVLIAPEPYTTGSFELPSWL